MFPKAKLKLFKHIPDQAVFIKDDSAYSFDYIYNRNPAIVATISTSDYYGGAIIELNRELDSINNIHLVDWISSKKATPSNLDNVIPEIIFNSCICFEKNIEEDEQDISVSEAIVFDKYLIYPTLFNHMKIIEKSSCSGKIITKYSELPIWSQIEHEIIVSISQKQFKPVSFGHLITNLRTIALDT